jgi:hydroxyacid-oxoacid transhydrogenase
MSCCSPLSNEFDRAFTIDASRVTFGRGCLAELGDRAKALGMTRVAVFSDPHVAQQPFFDTARRSLLAAGLDVVTFSDVHVEPTDESFQDAASFATQVKPHGYVSVGGGSVIDTCKAANLYATYPANFLTYVNSPIGDGKAVPGPLKPHIACPTTSGTGSEVTGIAICDLQLDSVKTGIASATLRPTEALVDPNSTATLPGEVVAASGLDILCHALESFTARPYLKRPAPQGPIQRPMSQGANPWSDIGCREALRLVGRYLQRAVSDADDSEARENTMWAATLAGIAFGNAGVHAPHGMAYAVAGLARSFRPAGYPGTGALVPHGMAVVVNAPSVVRITAETNPGRHLEVAQILGADTRSAGPEDAGAVLADELIGIMRALGMPNGLGGVGYTRADVATLTEGAFVQQRLLQNAPREITKSLLAELFSGAMRYW